MTKTHHGSLWLEHLEDRLVPSVDLTGVEWRTIDGRNNNLALPNQGAAETRQIRFGYGAQFPDGFGNAIITAPQRANPRTISNTIHAQSASVVNDRHLTDWIFQWGQFVTHDMDLTRNGPQWNALFGGDPPRPGGGGVGNFRIPIEDATDPLGPNPIPFNRSQFDPATGTPDIFPGTTRLNRREVTNSITSYIDGSLVYGSDPVRAAALRTFEAGKLKTSDHGRLLPLNTAGLPNADPFGMGAQLFLTGDVRANEQVNLTVVHTLFVREHNRLASRVRFFNPSLNDEQIYQVARLLVGAEMQIITYREYLPAMFGYDLAPRPQAAVYNPAVNATITNSFAHAAFRFGHSQINEAGLQVNNGGQTVGSLSIRDAFFNPDFLKNDPNNVGLVLKGLASQLAQENDLLLVDGIRNNLFGPPGAGGLDLGALDIQRGRDHGLPDYNTMRRLYGRGAVTTFAQISSDPQVQAKLLQLFGNVNNIDSFVGALADDHIAGSSAGALIHGIVLNQFERLRDGDRFFYTNDPFLAQAGVREILDLDQVSLSRLIRWNTHITNLQDNVFFDESVIVFEAPDAGANVTLTAANGFVSLINTRTSQWLAGGALRDVSQVILVGSDAARDFFNVFVAAANGGLENGVVVYGRNSAGDVLNVYGTAGNDAFTVDPKTVRVNGNAIFYFGLERIRLVTQGGNDTFQIDPNVVAIVDMLASFDPHDES